ncbi:MAG: protein kinase [Gemmatimonadetes bacterium]|nr:protein kinase [Gemmatimonadota bacterium]
MTDIDPMRARLAEAIAGDYDLLDELGRGGMATVHLAHDRALDRRVAIKMMAPHLVAVDGMAERFLQEARVAAALSHPHIVPIHAVRRSGDLLYFVMRYVEGRSLDVILAERGPLPVPMVRAILTQVGSALEAAHRKGVIHRDIKPANILIDEHGDAVVADFGIARVGARPGTTEVGQTVGTPEYMSTEQCAGWALTGAADQYSLGVVAYELLAGAPPFRGATLLEVVWKMVNEPAMPVIVHRRDVAEGLSDAIERMMSRRAEERFPSVSDAIASLPPLTLAPDDPVRRELIAFAAARATGHATDRATAAATTVGSSAARRAVPSASAQTVVTTPAAAAPVDVESLPLPDVTGRQGVPDVAALRLPMVAGVLTIDDVIPLCPEATDSTGRPIVDAGLAWTSSDPAVARVGPDGRVVAVGTGRAAITARSGDAMCTLSLVVTRAGLRTIALAPRPSALEVGDRLALTLATGESEALLPHPRLAAWRSSDPSVAAVDAVGRVSALREGAVEIIATTGGATGSVALRVTRAVITAVNVSGTPSRLVIGEHFRLSASAENAKGHPLHGLPVTWEVSDPAIAAISPDGDLVALRSGQVLVAARVSGRVGTTRVTVSAPAFAG